MIDISKTVITKSDQLNADDLIGGPIIIQITDVKKVENDQPVIIHYQGDNGKPYKPCKSMRRALIHCWGANAAAYPGRSLKLFCDPAVTFGGEKVGGIRISHASHINGPQNFPLSVTRGKKKIYTVNPLEVPAPPAPAPWMQPNFDWGAWETVLKQRNESAETLEEFEAISNDTIQAQLKWLKINNNEIYERVLAERGERRTALMAQQKEEF